MRSSWPIARIAGISIRIDTSWLFIFVFITWTLASYYFPTRYPDWLPWQYWALGLTSSLLLFASVLAHEMAHSLVAKHQGENVRSITLFILGGVAEITREPKTAGQEFYMAVVGPLTSLAIGGLFLALWLAFRNVSTYAAAISGYLALVNLFLGVFNLLPGFPMDGGRILRAGIWRVTGDLRKATRYASFVGQLIAFFLIALGVWYILSGFFFNGIWIALIGWFIHSAAVRSYLQVSVQQALQGTTARQLMNQEFETVSPDLSVEELVEDYIFKRRERAFLVGDSAKLQGIVCLEDAKQVPLSERSQTKVSQIMTPRDQLHTVGPDTSGNEVLARLARSRVHQLPVMERGVVIGILCRTDVLHYLHLRSELSPNPGVRS